MASGTLGQFTPLAATNTTVYTVPAGKTATISINVLNRGVGSITVRIAVAATGTPSDAEWIEYDATIIGSGVLERSGIVVSTAKNIVVYTSLATSSVNVYGFEE
jgi:hypothetical protein